MCMLSCVRVFVHLLQFLQSSLFLLQLCDMVVPLAQVTCQSPHLEVQTLNTPLYKNSVVNSESYISYAGFLSIGPDGCRSSQCLKIFSEINYISTAAIFHFLPPQPPRPLPPLYLFLLLSLGQCGFQRLQVSLQFSQLPFQLPSLAMEGGCVALFFLQALTQILNLQFWSTQASVFTHISQNLNEIIWSCVCYKNYANYIVSYHLKAVDCKSSTMSAKIVVQCQFCMLLYYYTITTCLGENSYLLLTIKEVNYLY